MTLCLRMREHFLVLNNFALKQFWLSFRFQEATDGVTTNLVVVAAPETLRLQVLWNMFRGSSLSLDVIFCYFHPFFLSSLCLSHFLCPLCFDVSSLSHGVFSFVLSKRWERFQISNVAFEKFEPMPIPFYSPNKPRPPSQSPSACFQL